ncbi:MLO-like protein 13 [Pyrus x bretschneideri]|uniref:MLO-like protein 13 n=1 Tax=Pyrus x bretschneideri TaxID=225117 RepID=UPI00202EDD30|nr:MLO-like protein 13 [Pyrus x bretschneideri]
MAEEEVNSSLEYEPTWVVAFVCFVIVLLSLCAERALHKLGKYLKHEKQDALFEALQKLKEELMLLGFISLLLTVSQRSIIRICIPSNLANHMLPCKRETSEGNNNAHYSLDQSINNRRRLLSADTNSDHCLQKGKVPLLSLEALHHLHIFIFVLAVVHVIFCVTTMVLGGARVRQWKHWEDSVRQDTRKSDPTSHENVHAQRQQQEFFSKRGVGYWRRAAIIGWVISFFKQFYGSVTKSDYIALRQGFIKEHFPKNPRFDFHKYMMRTLEIDFRKIVGISWYLWLFVVLFLLLNVEGWHTYFWLAFLPLILLLLVGAKLEHIIIRLAQEVTQGTTTQGDHEAAARVKPSDKHFWFNNPRIVLNLIHFILFQNSFEIAFFFWIWTTYGFHSCIMEKLGYIVPRLIMGVIVQVLCSYSTLPLYAIVSQMGSMYKEGMFDQNVQQSIGSWLEDAKDKQNKTDNDESLSQRTQMHNMMNTKLSQIDIVQQETAANETTTTLPVSSSQLCS